MGDTFVADPPTASAGPTATAEHTSFVPAEVLAQAGTMNKAQADLCPFGCVQVDDAGRVLVHNRYLSEMSGTSAKAAAGRNYFTQVNPCVNNPMFFGAFKRGVAADHLDEQFEYLFTYQMRPTMVRCHLVRDEPDQGQLAVRQEGLTYRRRRPPHPNTPRGRSPPAMAGARPRSRSTKRFIHEGHEGTRSRAIQFSTSCSALPSCPFVSFVDNSSSRRLRLCLARRGPGFEDGRLVLGLRSSGPPRPGTGSAGWP